MHLTKAIKPFTASVLASLLLFSCMVQPPVLNLQAPKGSFSIQNTKRSLVPQDTVYFYSSNPLNTTLPGFQTQALPKNTGCNGGCVNSLSAAMSWSAPGFAPQGDTLTLESLQPGSSLDSSFGYGLNVVETGIDSQGQAIATRISVGASAQRRTDTGGGQNYNRTEHLQMELTSTDSLNFSFDTSKTSSGDMAYNWALPPSQPGACNQAAWGGTGTAPVTQAQLLLNPDGQSAHLTASFSSSMTYSYYTGEGASPNCVFIPNQVGSAQGSIDIDFLVLFEGMPLPTPTPSSYPTPTPIPTPTPCPVGQVCPTPTPRPSTSATPSPIPTLLPPGTELECPVQVGNELKRLDRELDQLEAQIPGVSSTSGGFSVQFAPAIPPIGLLLYQVGTRYQTIYRASQAALTLILNKIATKSTELEQLKIDKAKLDADFAAAAQNLHGAEKNAELKRLREESNALNQQILDLESQQRSFEQQQANLKHTQKKLEQVGQNIAGVQAKAQDSCNSPNPSPSPSPSSVDPKGGSGETPGGISYYYDGKIAKNMRQRSWTIEDLENVIDNALKRFPSTDTRYVPGGGGVKNSDPVTVYYNANYEYVVINDLTHNVVQVSDRTDLGWIPSFPVP